MNVVRPCISRSIASMISASVRTSTELVGSSRIRIGRVLEERAGERDALPLAAGQAHAALADPRVVAVRQARR